VIQGHFIPKDVDQTTGIPEYGCGIIGHTCKSRTHTSSPGTDPYLKELTAKCADLGKAGRVGRRWQNQQDGQQNCDALHGNLQVRLEDGVDTKVAPKQ